MKLLLIHKGFSALQYNAVGLCFLCVCVQPHTWLKNGDTRFQLAHFKKDRRKRDGPDISEHIMKGLPQTISLSFCI